MKALDRKLLRDLWSLRTQAITIALVVAAGIGGFIGSLSTHDSLIDARDRYYAEARFADVFGAVKRAPQALVAQLAELSGVAEVQSRLVFDAQLALPDVRQPLAGRLIGSSSDELVNGINRVTLRRGQWPAPGTNQALVNQAFAKARGLAPGDTLTVLLNGRLQRLVIAGIALSPEYVYAASDALLADDRSFAVLWIDRDLLEAAFDMQGAFNSVVFRLRSGASVDAAIDGIDRTLAGHGSRGAFARAEQSSDLILSGEIQQQRAFGIVLPSVFLAVAVFILNVVIGRQIGTQRDQIAALKALGYEDRWIGAHYLKLSGAMVALGVVLGIGLGAWLGRTMTRLYTEFFHFPVFDFRIEPATVLTASLVCIAVALGAAWLAVRSVVSLRPAEAMRPPAPPTYRAMLLERMGFGARLGPALKMVVRSVERRPRRALLTVFGIASAVAILIAGTWWRDAIDHLLEIQFAAAQPGDLYLVLTDAREARVARELARLPGVVRSEVSRSAAVRVHAGHIARRSAAQGLAPDAQLRRLVDDRYVAQALPAAGLLMTDRLAEVLGVRPGDTVRIELLEGDGRTRDMTVAGLVHEPMGLGVYMDAAALDDFLGEHGLVNGAAVRTDGRDPAALYDALRAMPHVAGVFVKSALLTYTRETTARNILVFTAILTVFAAAIAVGVVYNSARIALAERAWELATLRVLGMTRREVSAILLGELAAELLLAIPLGFAGGWLLADLLVSFTNTDQFRIPVVILPRTYAFAALVTLAAGGISAWVVQRRLGALDMVGVLKTRE